MTSKDNTSEQSDAESEQLPAAAEITTPAEETYAITLCDANYANIIVDMENSDDLNPEIRVYPVPRPGAHDELEVISLPNYEPNEGTEPVVNIPETESPTEFSIQLPVDGEFVDIVTIDVDSGMPFVTVTVPESFQQENAQRLSPAFQRYVVHHNPSR